MNDENKDIIGEPFDFKKYLDSKYPLLEVFREKTPGTYKHSQNVSLLCESVALGLDLNVDEMKVIGLYHDIGKMNFPENFSENQNGTNVHDDLDPFVSYHLITRHIGDSAVILLNKTDLPRDIISKITEHHGNTVLQYFYEKSGSSTQEVYRYKCSPPTTIESTVLMLCDSIDATARALASANELNTAEDRKSVVSNTLNRLMDDDQLDGMTVGSIKIIRRVLLRELETIYHKREVYGNEKKEVVNEDSVRIEEKE